MKNAVTIVLILFVAVIAAGCVEAGDFKIEPVVLAKDPPEAPPVPLDQIAANNAAALAFAGEKQDFLEGDKYLTYVVDAKERDALSQTKAAALAIQASVDQAQAELDSQAPGASSSPQTEPPASSQPATGGSGSDGQTGSSVRYYNTALSYSIEFPFGWTQIDTTFGEMQLVAAVSQPVGAGDKFLENLGVAVQQLPIEMSSSEYLELSLNGLKASLAGFEEIDRLSFTLDGQSGKKVVFTYMLDGTKMTDVLYEVVNGLSAYVIVGTADSQAYADYADDFDAAAGSFKFE